MAVIQRDNRGNRKPPKGKPFVKGDPRINRLGRPRDHDKLRELIQELGGEVLDDKGKTQIIAMLRKMFKSRSPEDRKQLLEHGWGKVKDEIDHTIKGEIEVKAVDYRNGLAALETRPIPDRNPSGETQISGDGPTLGQDGSGRGAGAEHSEAARESGVAGPDL